MDESKDTVNLEPPDGKFTASGDLFVEIKLLYEVVILYTNDLSV